MLWNAGGPDIQLLVTTTRFSERIELIVPPRACRGRGVCDPQRLSKCSRPLLNPPPAGAGELRGGLRIPEHRLQHLIDPSRHGLRVALASADLDEVDHVPVQLGVNLLRGV